jgi:PAS domain S-box-containing protein
MASARRQGGPGTTEPRIDLEDLLRLLVESVKDYAIFVLDPDGIIRTWNPGAERLKGYRASEIIGRHFSQFYTPADVAVGRPQNGLRRALADGRYEDEGWRVRKDGTLFWADVVISAMYDETGEHRGFAKVTRDLTERRNAEEERIKLARAEEAVRLREEFMSIAAHELRTPLNALKLQILALKLLLEPERYPELDRVQAARKVERLLHLTDRFAKLISSLLDSSRLSSGRLTLEKEEMDLIACAKDMIVSLQDRSAAKQVRIELHGPRQVIGHWDRLRIEQVISNLLDNAIVYGEGAPVDVFVEADDALATLRVVDAGPGIAPEDRGRIFERFARGGPSPTGHGLGLGLYITRAIVEAHGGRIELRDSPRGADFAVRLPRRADASEEPKQRMGT